MNENYIKVRSEDKSDASNVKSTTLVADETGLRFYHADSGSGVLAKDRVWTLVLPNGNARTKVTSNSIGVYNATSSGTEQLKWELVVPDGSHVFNDQAFKSIETANPITKTENTSEITIKHATTLSGAVNVGDISDQTPGFGGTFKALNVAANVYGHVTTASEHTVKIPNTSASSSASGLMTSSMYNRLYGGTAFVQIQNFVTSEPIELDGVRFSDIMFSSGSNTISNNNPKFYEIEGGGISVNCNCNVSVSASAYFDFPSSGISSARICVQLNRKRGESTVNVGEFTTYSTGDSAISVGPKILTLLNGDIICLSARAVYSSSTSNITVRENVSTYLNMQLLNVN